MKALKPSMKEKKRYLLIKSKKIKNSTNLKKKVESAIMDFIGVLGKSKTGMSWIKSKNNSTILCVNREMVDKIRASICVSPEDIQITKVSGTLKSLE